MRAKKKEKTPKMKMRKQNGTKSHVNIVGRDVSFFLLNK